jgi:hypothetical protein
MTAKEKAEDLYIKYIDAYNDRNLQVSDYKFAKQCALIAVDEMLKAVDNPDETYLMQHSVNYWTEVKEQIEKL